ncbi:hypothetical protein VTJ04DRAFT_4368 [Mycothermus thermophilus]|uniref:uncharacterized protein n=1 Tax=Humicola insolens TaxID=85995 RepID=UPI003742E91F
MADDGLLLNFEIPDAPLKTQVKFKGGRWRDRLKAQRSAKQQATQPKQAQHPSSTPQNHHNHDAARPSKRPRTDEDDSGRHAKLQKTNGPAVKTPSHALRTGQISSGLFTKNPTAVTDFENAPVVDDAEPAKPSNAPLSEEAASFFSLGLSRRIAQHLTTKLEMKAPTAIQKRTVPQLINEDSDAFLQAETGSGKTLAYLLPIVHRIMALSVNPDGTLKDTKVHRNSGLFAIVLGPTRELCKQIAVVLEKLLRCAPWLVCTTVIGGESKKSEKARLRKGVNILVATPGRLADHLDNTKVLDVGTVRWLVLDEGDRMMEMGFEEDIRAIVGKIRAGKLLKENAEGVKLEGILPSRRVTVLCSATMKMNVQKLGEISLVDAVHITVSKSDVDGEAEAATEAAFAAPSQLKQSYIVTPAKLRLVTLISLLKSTFARKGSVMKAIIFISCADSVDFHYELLKDTKPLEPPTSDSSPSKNGHNSNIEQTVAPAAYVTSPANPKVILHKLHGSLPQPVRSATLNHFSRCKDPAVLITTDISSRGLDVPSVDLVIEYDPAFAVADHVHRIGRTARAGRPGKAVLFLLPGCEEGYVSILPASTPIVPQSYESILQKGLVTAVNLPSTYTSTETEKQTWTTRAESLQLHLEQRLLANPSSGEDSDAEADDEDGAKGKGKSKSKKKKPQKKKPAPENPLLVSGRQAFRSHIRAYATHVKEERQFFDITQLHLGHVAKAFALRETPGGIGGGVSRRTHKASTSKGAAAPAPAASEGGAGEGGEKKKKAKKARDDDDDDGVGKVDADAAKRMQEKLKMMMNASSEFNIG